MGSTDSQIPDPLEHPDIHRVDRQPDQTANQCAVDPDELQVASDSTLDPVGDRRRIPPLDGFRYQPDDLVAITIGDPYRASASETVLRRR